MRIRKIIAQEVWRLMCLDDEDYLKASKVCCETLLYQQTGNFMVVNVIYYLLKKLFT